MFNPAYWIFNCFGGLIPDSKPAHEPVREDPDQLGYHKVPDRLMDDVLFRHFEFLVSKAHLPDFRDLPIFDLRRQMEDGLEVNAMMTDLYEALAADEGREYDGHTLPLPEEAMDR